jgi:hypothetical protein
MFVASVQKRKHRKRSEHNWFSLEGTRRPHLREEVLMTSEKADLLAVSSQI